MKQKLISQREARSLRKRVKVLESILSDERASWRAVFPGGINIGSVSWDEDNRVPAAVYTARKLGHAVVATSDDYRKFNLYAVPMEKFP